MQHKISDRCAQQMKINFSFFLKLLTIVFLSETDMPIMCPTQWMSYAGHCYLIHKDLKIWKDALTFCRKEDGDLASIHNVEEYSFIVSQLGYREYLRRAACMFT